ncbi:MAG: sugar phosphate isomerase/epimerase family protein [Opitutaceae bacterium]
MAEARAFRLPWSFSSLGCPELDLDGIFALAREAGIAVVELRAIGGTIDLPAYFAKTFGSPAAFAAHVGKSGVGIASLDTSFRIIDGDAAARAQLLDFLPWAEALGGVPLRVFDGGTTLDEHARAAIRETVQWWDHTRAAAGWRSSWIIETHDCLFTAAAIEAVMREAPESVRLLWDSHHTWKRGGEEPVETWKTIRPWVRHVHVKDSVSRPSARHPFSYVFLGEGEFPLRALIDALRDDAFDGILSLEWERMWHRELPPLEQALDRARRDGWM